MNITFDTCDITNKFLSYIIKSKNPSLSEKVNEINKNNINNKSAFINKKCKKFSLIGYHYHKDNIDDKNQLLSNGNQSKTLKVSEQYDI